MVKNLKDLMKKFADEDVCRQHLENRRWPDGKIKCQYCGHDHCYKIENGTRYKCANNKCYKRFKVTVGTIFEASNIPLSTWFPALYIILSHKKGISSIQLGKDLGVTQKTAWFMLHRIREQLKANGSVMLKGVVEVDETFVGGKVGNMHKSKRAKMRGKSEGITNKTPVFGMLERGGNVMIVQVPYATGEVLQPIIRKHVEAGSTMCTDGFGGYRYMDEYTHEAVSHDKKEYVRGTFHTNGIEGYFGLFKRMVIGIYHQVSVKHLQRYCDEHSYRYNSRKLKDGERFEISLSNLEGRLTYNQLVYGSKEKPAKKES
jgi:transposase-like protein